MKKIYSPVFAFTILAFFVACSPRVLDKSYNQPITQKLYSQSIGDAAKPQPWEISNQLSAVNKTNNQLIWKDIDGEKHILVSSWKTDTTYYKNNPATGKYNTGKYPIWVTLAPELQTKCRVQKFGRKEGLNLRLKQLLGLPPNTNQQYFIEFWVKPQDLFRPCPDSEVTDTRCEIGFPDNTTEDHKTWVNNLRLASYYHVEWDKNYPWTELGYTYDWNPKVKNNIGLSEFVIGEQADIVVHKVYTTLAYCSGGGE